MQAYIGTKIVQAEPESEHAFRESKQLTPTGKPDRPGYCVIYSDGYVSWSPKEVFEEAYRPINVGEVGLVANASVPT